MRNGRGRVAATIVVAILATACTGGPRPAPAPERPDEAPFLPAPSLGYPLDPGAAASAELQRLHEGLISGRMAPDAVAAGAEALVGADAGLGAARVLLAEAKLVAGDSRGAAEEAGAAAARHDGYTAAQVVAGRAHEQLGEIVEAYAYYRSAAAPVGAARAAELEGRAFEVLRRRIEDALARGRVDLARGALDRLEAWAPGQPSTLEAALAVAETGGDRDRELAILREMGPSPTAAPERAVRHARLEMEIGDPGAGLDLFQRLVREHPGDARFADELEGAKFRFRLLNLPQEVQGSARAPQLTRGQYAVLLYWLVPGVRVADVATARIATDILDHPQRQAIIRVVNLGLMDVDPNLRQFQPERPVRRERALRSLLRILQRRETPASCVAPLEGNPAPSTEAICAAAAACRLIASPADCLPESGVSGQEALDWIRRTVTE